MMKNLLLAATAAAAFCAAPAMAQTFPSPLLDNSARITQTGDRNNANVNQAVGGLANGAAQADVEQTGNRNAATVSQQNTQAMTARMANVATVTQITSRASADVRQIHDYGAFGNNRATIVQRRTDSVADIDQRGDRNTATIRQLTAAVAPTGAISQNGLRNTATVEQHSNMGSVIVQQGTFSTASGVSPDSQRNTATVVSSGANPDIFVRQGGADNIADVLENGSNGRIDINSYGMFNDVSVTQSSANGIVDVFTAGTSFLNVADVVQAVSDNGSEAYISQSGSYSEASITQSDTSALGGGNFADITQTGSAPVAGGIFASIAQNGGHNSATTTQASAAANSVITQAGLSHVATVNQ